MEKEFEEFKGYKEYKEPSARYGENLGSLYFSNSLYSLYSLVLNRVQWHNLNSFSDYS